MTDFSDTTDEIANDAKESARRGREKYSRFLDDEAWAMLDSMSEGDKAYFWAYLEETIPLELEKAALEAMEREIIDGDRAGKLSGMYRAHEPVAKPFEHAERSISAHAVFGKSLIQRQFGA